MRVSYDTRDDEGWTLDTSEPDIECGWAPDYSGAEVTAIRVDRVMVRAGKLIRGEPLDLLDPHMMERPFLFALGVEMKAAIEADKKFMEARTKELRIAERDMIADARRRERETV